jgi:hypothetical protein
VLRNRAQLSGIQLSHGKWAWQMGNNAHQPKQKRPCDVGVREALDEWLMLYWLWAVLRFPRKKKELYVHP